MYTWDPNIVIKDPADDLHLKAQEHQLSADNKTESTKPLEATPTQWKHPGIIALPSKKRLLSNSVLALYQPGPPIVTR